MDPLSIASSVISVSATCLKTAKTLHDVRGSFKDAPMYLVSITSETTLISASLSNVQSLLLREPDLPNLLASRPELIAALDASLTGCMVLFSCLNDEMSRLRAYAQAGAMSWRGKARMVWNKDKLKELLEGLRGLQMSMNLLIQLLQVDSLAEIKKIVEKGRPALADTVQRTQSLRSTYPNIGVAVAESIYSQENREDSGDAEEYASSIWSDREFDFDDLVINSKVYRRALAAARAGKQPDYGIDGQTNEQTAPEPNEQVLFEGDLIDFSDAATITQKTVEQSSIYGATRELAGLNLSEEPSADSTSKILVNSVNEQTPSTESSIDRPKSAVPENKSPGGWYTADKLLSAKSPTAANELLSANTSMALQKGRPGVRLCTKCDEVLTGQFVRALGGTYHLDCFKCADCGQIVASKFFPVDEGEGSDQYPLCETDYFRRLDLICFSCGHSLRGSYTTALGRKYHNHHFTCSLCPTLFGAEDSYYEHDGNVYCHFHYTTMFAQSCLGCQTAILKQFVEIFRNGQNQHWHPECYMIHKYWNVRLGPIRLGTKDGRYTQVDKGLIDNDKRDLVRREIDEAEELTAKIWNVLSGFEEYSASLISDTLLYLSTPEALLAVPPLVRFIDNMSGYLDCLEYLDIIRKSKGLDRLPISREFKLLCKKIVGMLSFMSKHLASSKPKLRLGVTQELLSLVTGLAHYLKLLIRIGLQGALKASAVDAFLDGIPKKGERQPFASAEEIARLPKLARNSADLCDCCGKQVDQACYMVLDLSYHLGCIVCPQCKKNDAYTSDVDREEHERGTCKFCGYLRHENITFIGTRKQYIRLLWIAFARFLVVSNIDWTDALVAESNSPKAPDIPKKVIENRTSDESTDSLLLDDIPRIVATLQSS